MSTLVFIFGNTNFSESFAIYYAKNKYLFPSKMSLIGIKLGLPRLKLVLPILLLEMTRLRLVLPRLKLVLPGVYICDAYFQAHLAI
jgi:hypothetical protein